MRDLKHLIYFENLLQQANNDLVQAACGDGRLALAWNCSYIPEVLLDTDKCFGVRLRAPNCTNPDMATYYMTNRSCPYSKSILERAFEGERMIVGAIGKRLPHGALGGVEQRDQLEERIATMQQTLERLNHKIENYGNCLAKEPELRGKAKD